MIKAFNRWDTEGIKVADPGLIDYITLEPKIVPKTGARYIGNKFHKSRIFIVERLINKIMVPGHKGKKHFRTSSKITGKAGTAYSIVEKTFALIESRLKENPIKVFVKALENAAPREEIITIEYGGARYPKAVECAPQRRIDVALRLMTQGSYQKSFNSKKSIEECLADEIINAYKLSANSTAVAKKQELERQADASR
jgi:small subunit ribosomal protein S7